MSRVFTIYNCGTAFDENKSDLIAELARGTQGDFVINAGPGSAAMMRQATQQALTANPAKTALKQLASLAMGGSAPVVDPLLEAAVGIANAWGGGLAFGSGMENRIQDTLAALGKLPRCPQVINMASWSRGCITSMLLAHYIEQMKGLESCWLNMFLIDPVPGPRLANFWNWTKKKTTLSANVKRCSVILQENARETLSGYLMTPVTWQYNPDGEIENRPGFVAYPMPGLHASAVQKSDEGTRFAKYNAVADLVRYLCEAFLVESGTDLPHFIAWSDIDICEAYAEIKLNTTRLYGEPEPEFLDGRKKMVPNMHRTHGFFVNWHHLATFKMLFPKIAEALTSNTVCAEISKEVSQLQSVAPMSSRLFKVATEGRPVWRAIARSEIKLHAITGRLGRGQL